MKKLILIITSTFLIIGCAKADNNQPDLAKKYISTRKDLSPEITKAILNGKTILGMYPDEAVAASGSFFYTIDSRGSIKVSCADISLYFDYIEEQPNAIRMPPDILWKQRFQPDGSRIALGFTNTSQFDSESPVSFVVIFSGGKAVAIQRGDTDQGEVNSEHVESREITN